MGQAASLPSLRTTVRLYQGPQSPNQRAELLGFADLVIAEAFVIKGIRILAGKAGEDKPAGRFIAFPSRKGGGSAQDRYFEVAYPITAQARQAVKEAVLKSYEEQARAGA